MTSWRTDPDLARGLHPDFPDDLQVIIHDGEPRRTKRSPEACWVRLAGVHERVRMPIATRDAQPPITPDRVQWIDRTIYRGALLNKPHLLTTVREGDTVLVVAAPGMPHPLQVTPAYLAERARWAYVPCDRCGADQSLDPPTLMWRTRFPDQAGVAPVAFTAFCPCGGTQMLLGVTASGSA